MLVKVTFLLFVVFFSCDTRNQVSNEQALPLRDEVPQVKSRVFSTKDFSVELPESLRDVPVVKDDSPLWKFGDEKMTVTIESGPYAGAYGDHYKSYSDYKVEERTIDGEAVKIVSFNFGEKSDSLIEPSKAYLIGVHFRRSERVKSEITAQVLFSSANDYPTALDILTSIKFR